MHLVIRKQPLEQTLLNLDIVPQQIEPIREPCDAEHRASSRKARDLARSRYRFLLILAREDVPVIKGMALLRGARDLRFARLLQLQKECRTSLWP